MKKCIVCKQLLGDNVKICGKCRAEQPDIINELQEVKSGKKVSGNLLPVQTQPQRTSLIYKMTAQNNCGKCGCDKCMQFAMKAASLKRIMELTKCPYINEDKAEEYYDSISTLTN